MSRVLHTAVGSESLTTSFGSRSFYSNLDRLFVHPYVPTDQDVLRCRQRTTGISETIFNSADLQYR